jgi:hypothetical protein
MIGLIFKKYFSFEKIHIFVFSFIVFIVLNVIENVIHYNIGKYHNTNDSITDFHFTNPSKIDWIRIFVIMVIFAFLQGVFTSYFSVC